MMPEASEASPAPNFGRCIYGFVLYTLSNALLVLFLISLLPDELIDFLQLSGFPSCYWYITLSSLLLLSLILFGTIIYPTIIYSLTESLDSPALFFDSHSYLKQGIHGGGDVWTSEIPPIYDIPLEQICPKMYYDKKLVVSSETSIASSEVK
ncbi:phosphatidylinositol glycan anchor biosynthesis class P [Brevipalpus obovatus]|uniref:phosphatidylinositol glycan anchor biosynthesis class P n=1 Tax=Brevipalpus obovatus TaxID=246614 RepID=UPI003D9EFA00